MKNTIENKQRFFDAYSGQKIFRYSWNEELYTNRYLDQEKLHKYTAELKLLSEISDENAIEVGKIINNVFINSDIELRDMGTWNVKNEEYLVNLQIADYLRSKGYLLPFMDLTIEQILEYGWAVLKSK